MPLNTIKALLAESLEAVDELILKSVRSKINLINDVGIRIIQSGGKRLRPIMLLLSANACGYQSDQHIRLAAIIEFIHTATLLHDDVIDHSNLRRGQRTVNHVWGNEAAVLVGDFLYSRAMQMMVDFEDSALMKVVAETVNVMAEGEILQLLDRHNLAFTEGAYLNVIQSKTAKLFEASALLGAVLAKTTPDIQNNMAHYGMHVGTAFQLMDDILDYRSSASTMGKMPGNDLAEGKLTLPLIHAMQQATHQELYLMKQAIEDIQAHPEMETTEKPFVLIQSMIAKYKSLDYALSLAKNEVKRAVTAIKHLPASTFKEALIALAEFAINRAS